MRFPDSMSRLFCIAAGQEHTRKVPNRINTRHLYLNYGLLGLATLLARRGVDAVQIQGDFDQPAQTFAKCISHGLAESQLPVFLSVPSFYALSWARKFVSLIKADNPARKIIVGGRWVVGDCPDLLSEALGGVDLVLPGLGEARLDAIVEQYIRPNSPRFAGVPRINHFHQHDYSLLVDRAEYQPSIEIARGCGMGCSFCQERSEPLSPLKPPEIIVAELRHTLLRDHLRPMTPYFEASVFAPGAAWVTAMGDAFRANGIHVKWRTEARVDTITPERVEALVASGLSILDLGLESASPTQLLRMQKTKDPQRYLSRASALLKAARSSGLRTKVNVLLFAGETMQTLRETVDWLEAHRECITGVSVGPVMVFGWPGSTAQYLEEVASLGARPASGAGLQGVQELHLSKEMDAEQSQSVARAISRRFMTARAYYELKSFSYFPRSYSYAQFAEDVRATRSELTFDRSEIDMDADTPRNALAS